MDKGPVIVELSVEYPGVGSDGVEAVEIDRAEWDAMTPAERVARCDEMAEVHALNVVNWGWGISDPDDDAQTIEHP